MAKEPEIEGLFDRNGQERKMNRILDRAVKMRVRETTRGGGTVGEIKVPKFAVGNGIKAKKKGLGAILARAMSVRTGKPKDASGGPAPSMRKSAPDTGGRSFHFEYYSVSKKDVPQSTRGAAQAGGRKGTGGAHQRYIEREIALEDKVIEVKRKRGRPSKAMLAERAAKEAKAMERDPMERSAAGAGASQAAQAYIENPAKLQNGEIGLSSFGNIGETFEERLKFWELVEKHEPHPDARIQNRLILELPHQSTPEARREIMKRFVEPLVERNLPYHVAIHAPGEKNDSRNFHAHVVFSERPAKRMVDPANGLETWDFAISVTSTDKHWNTRTRYPHRQNRHKDLRDIHFVRGLRRDFAKHVTDVMAGVDPSVKFDARSYKDMGLNVAPMETIHRVLHDRMRDGALVLMNGNWSKRMVAAEVDAAAQRKDPDVERLLVLTEQLAGLREAWPDIKAVNGKLDVNHGCPASSASPSAGAGNPAPAPQPRTRRRSAPQARILEEGGAPGAIDPSRRPVAPAPEPPARKSVSQRDTATAEPQVPGEYAVQPRPMLEQDWKPAPQTAPMIEREQAPPLSLEQESTGKVATPPTAVEQSAPTADATDAASAETARKKKAGRRKAMLARSSPRGGRGGR